MCFLVVFLLLEGKDKRIRWKHLKNCGPCHLSINGSIHYELVVVLDSLPCFVCCEKKGVSTILLYNQCQRGWHMACLIPPFQLFFLKIGFILNGKSLPIMCELVTRANDFWKVCHMFVLNMSFN